MSSSLVAANRATLIAVHVHLSVVAFLVADPGLWSTGSVVIVHRVSCSAACGDFLDQS